MEVRGQYLRQFHRQPPGYSAVNGHYMSAVPFTPPTMSTFQVEELIASFNTTNISTEALELAKLQAQLQQALEAYPQGAPFPTSPVQISYSHSGGAPANTPTTRTPGGPNWGQFADASHGRRRRSSSAADVRSRNRQVIREEGEDHWRNNDLTKYEMEQDVMEDVEEEAQVDASLYSTTSPVQHSHPSASPTFGSSPTTYASTDPFLAQQLQAVEQRSRQPTFFAQIATAQQQTSPFYNTNQQLQQPSSNVLFQAQAQPAMFAQSGLSRTRPVRHPLTIDTGPRFATVDPTRIR